MATAGDALTFAVPLALVEDDELVQSLVLKEGVKGVGAGADAGSSGKEDYGTIAVAFAVGDGGTQVPASFASTKTTTWMSRVAPAEYAYVITAMRIGRAIQIA
ncbi:hypothetical protein HDU82_006521 [Entophlyctis luteolus]|nr:hypothetical protein HDU82_006521 [Entophlyctis luteolus]KAJ3378372.1 hypothetical protein HDU84_007625 [Entophlyctis sp. JEL0112]